MDCYLLTLYVSLEQELAIRELFVYNGWNFNKYQDSTYESYTSKQDLNTCLPRKNLQDPGDTSQTKLLIGENPSIKNVDLETDAQTEIFSDLQHFVEATLIAVTTESDKTDCPNSENELSDETSPGISDVKQSSTSDYVTGTNSEAIGNCNDNFGTRHNICVHRSGTGTSDDSAYKNDTVNGLQESNLGTSSNIFDGDKPYCGTSNEFTVVNGSISGISNIKGNIESDQGTSNSFANGNQPFCENSNLIKTNVTTDADIKSDIEETVHNNFNPEEIQESSSPGDTSTKLFKADENKNKNAEKRVLRRNTGKKRNEPKGKIKLKEKKIENRKYEVLLETTVKSGKKSKVGLFHCKECDYTFRFLGAYKNHKKDGKCLFECEYCGKTFTSRYYSNYQSHLKYHVKDRPHKCNVCGKSYIEAQTLKIHMRKHSGDRPYICHHCGRQFYSSSNLLSHRNSAHSDTREIHKCDICDARLSTLGNLRVHKKVVHAVERPFTCEICGKSFKTQKSLEQVHAKVHSEDFPYKCDFIECGKMFKRSEGLADHMRRHNNDRNHFCERCGKGFYSNKELTLHTRTHTGEKPHTCQLCDYKCALAGNLRKHMKTHLSAQ
ncbi:zinc finger protein 391-like [Mercenaria mercenaria]|uniref:zinc finger protein 391-like n=1 Tax=Mercenaria mercenaria TaxID=6596 RepID=UPI00234E9827|nr:zinc finger protein 391-like [Mercenaria mercenaria]XP_045190603.2 zinc finger protein 391-like [Mercenaria mercenaria]XP_053407734.1 zinc finger protein 391-like [Mercenaria mercenaria]